MDSTAGRVGSSDARLLSARRNSMTSPEQAGHIQSKVASPPPHTVLYILRVIGTPQRMWHHCLHLSHSMALLLLLTQR